MSSLADNDAHISLARTAPFAWCQCFAAFIPDQVRGDEAWALFERVRRVWERELGRWPGRLAPARSMADVDAALAAGRTAGLLTVEGASFLEDDAAAEGRLDALAEAGVRMVTLTWNGRNALGSGNDTADGLSWLDPCDQVGGLHALIASRFGREVADKAFFGNARAFFERLEGQV